MKLDGFHSISELVINKCIPTDCPNTICNYSDEERNTEDLHIRVTREEKKEIVSKAKNSGLLLSRYVRNCCLKKNIIVLTNLKELSKELNKVGTNLNQVARLCNEGLITCPDISETKEELAAIYKELKKLNKKAQPGR